MSGSFFEVSGAIPRDSVAVPRECPGDSPHASAATEENKIPWWLWWNVLSLDAPLVAVAWLALFANSNRQRLPAVNYVALALTVWIIYASDRLLDGWTAKSREALRERHRFSSERRLMLGLLLAAASTTMFLLVRARLPTEEAVAGLKLGVLVAAYMAGIHLWQSATGWLRCKEIAVGSVFALGTTLPLWSEAARLSPRILAPWIFFGLLCCLNTWSIERWEKRSSQNSGGANPHRMGPRPEGDIAWLAGGLAAAALVTAAVSWAGNRFATELLAVALGATLIMLINFARKNLSAAALRVLADVALLVPPGVMLLRSWQA
jgi:hypothetical protein